MASKKVPALSLVFVGIVGMVAGVIAATMVVTQTTFTGEQGVYHNSTGSFTITDVGLRVVANTASAALTSATIGANGTNTERNTALTAGRWMYVLEFTTTLTDSTSHTATVTIRSGTGNLGATVLVNAQTQAIVAPSAVSTGKITLYLDLGVTTITAPVTVYATVS